MYPNLIRVDDGDYMLHVVEAAQRSTVNGISDQLQQALKAERDQCISEISSFIRDRGRRIPDNLTTLSLADLRRMKLAIDRAKSKRALRAVSSLTSVRSMGQKTTLLMCPQRGYVI